MRIISAYLLYAIGVKIIFRNEAPYLGDWMPLKRIVPINLKVETSAESEYC